MVIIGLTGGKQQGKSTVGNLLRQMVGPVADLEFSDLMMDLANNWLGHLPAAANQSTDTLGLANQWIRSLPEAFKETEYQISCPTIEISHDHPHYQAFHHHLVTYLDNLSDPYNPGRITRETKVDHRHIYIWLAVTL